jgi:hypothetical protein
MSVLERFFSVKFNRQFKQAGSAIATGPSNQSTDGFRLRRSSLGSGWMGKLRCFSSPKLRALDRKVRAVLTSTRADPMSSHS